MAINHLPRRGQYELFIFKDWIYCFDDVDNIKWPNNGEMMSWLSRQNPLQCRAYRAMYNGKPDAYYLDPPVYLMWKLSWSEYATEVSI